MSFHVFAQTTHVVAAPRGFACVGMPATRLYIPSFIKIRLAFPITVASRFYNSLYYRTSRDELTDFRHLCQELSSAGVPCNTGNRPNCGPPLVV